MESGRGLPAALHRVRPLGLPGFDRGYGMQLSTKATLALGSSALLCFGGLAVATTLLTLSLAREVEGNQLQGAAAAIRSRLQEDARVLDEAAADLASLPHAPHELDACYDEFLRAHPADFIAYGGAHGALQFWVFREALDPGGDSLGLFVEEPALAFVTRAIAPGGQVEISQGLFGDERGMAIFAARPLGAGGARIAESRDPGGSSFFVVVGRAVRPSDLAERARLTALRVALERMDQAGGPAAIEGSREDSLGSFWVTSLTPPDPPGRVPDELLLGGAGSRTIEMVIPLRDPSGPAQAGLRMTLARPILDASLGRIRTLLLAFAGAAFGLCLGALLFLELGVFSRLRRIAALAATASAARGTESDQDGVARQIRDLLEGNLSVPSRARRRTARRGRSARKAPGAGRSASADRVPGAGRSASADRAPGAGRAPGGERPAGVEKAPSAETVSSARKTAGADKASRAKTGPSSKRSGAKNAASVKNVLRAWGAIAGLVRGWMVRPTKEQERLRPAESGSSGGSLPETIVTTSASGQDRELTGDPPELPATEAGGDEHEAGDVAGSANDRVLVIADTEPDQAEEPLSAGVESGEDTEPAPASLEENTRAAEAGDVPQEATTDPVTASSDAAEADPPGPKETGTGAGRAPVKERVIPRALLVDRSEARLEPLARAFVRAGWVIEKAHDPEDLTGRSLERLDMAVIDLDPPNRRGSEVIAAIREGEKRGGRYVPLVALLDQVSQEARETWLRAGIDDLVPRSPGLDHVKVLARRWAPEARARLLLPCPFDLEWLEEISDHDPAFAAATISSFLPRARTLLAEIEEQIRGGDHAGAKTKVAALRSDAASMGAWRLGDACSVLEAALGSGSAQWDPLVASIRNCLEAAARFTERYHRQDSETDGGPGSSGAGDTLPEAA